MKQSLFVLAGATASGKTALAASLIQQYPFEIVSADSRQVYKGLDIGAGKNVSLMQHMIDVVNPPKSTLLAAHFSVAQYRKMALPIIQSIYDRGHIPLLVGGSGYYIDALLSQSLTNQTKPNQIVRARIEQLSTEELLSEIEQKDPATLARIDQKNRRRLVRAVEIIRQTGKPIAANYTNTSARFEVHRYILNPDRKVLYHSIDERVLARLDEGMVEEVKNMRARGVPDQWLINLGLEYRFITQYLQGNIGYTEMVEQLRYGIHAYARRQISYFRRWADAGWGSEEMIINKISAQFGLITVERF